MGTRRGARIVATALTLLGPVAASTSSWGAEIGEVIDSEGDATRLPGGGRTERKLVPGDQLHLHDTIRTETESTAQTLLRYRKVETLWTVLENSTIYFDEDKPRCKQRETAEQQGQTVAAQISKGTVRGAISWRSDSGFVTEVRTPNVVICAPKTTSFVIRFTPPETTEVMVLEGEVFAATFGNLEEWATVSADSNNSYRAEGDLSSIGPADGLESAQESRFFAQVSGAVNPTERLSWTQPSGTRVFAEVPYEVPGDPSVSPRVEGPSLVNINIRNPNL